LSLSEAHLASAASASICRFVPGDAGYVGPDADDEGIDDRCLVPSATRSLATDHLARHGANDVDAFVADAFRRFPAPSRVSFLKESEEMKVSAKEAWLPAYLHDHLAGSVTAVDIARRRRDAETDGPSKAALELFIQDVQEDRERLRELMSRLGIVPSVWKQAAATGVAWLDTVRSMVGPSDLHRIRDFELLLMGVRGKELLWHTLSRVGVLDPASQRLLLERVASQRLILEQLHAPRTVDTSPSEPTV